MTALHKFRDYLTEAIPSSQKKKIENLKPNDKLIVYHGTDMKQVGHFINGFDTTQAKPRIYNTPRHNGLFVTADPEVAMRYAHGGQVVLELVVRAKNMHGVAYGGIIGRKKDLGHGTTEFLQDEYPNSFRKYLSMTMLQKTDPQGLLVGLVSPKQIKRVWHEGKWYTRKEFIELDIKGIEDFGIDVSATSTTAQEFIDYLKRDHPRHSSIEKLISDFIDNDIKNGTARLMELLDQADLEPRAAEAMKKKLYRYFGVDR